MKKNIILSVSIIINLLLIAVMSIYIFSPLLDMVIIRKSLPRFCTFVEKNSPENYSDVKICNLDEQLEKILTYANDKYGFSFQYPSELEINDNDFEEEPAPGGIISSIEVGNDILIAIGMHGKDSIGVPNGIDPTSTKTEVTIDGIKGILYINDSVEVYNVIKDNYRYEISNTNKSDKETISKVINTFKFTK